MKNLYEGLRILIKYWPDGDCSAEHDIIYAGGDDDKTISPEDSKRLDELGWWIADEYDCWAHFT